MTRQQWQPFSPLWRQFQDLQSEMNRLFDRWNPSSEGRGTGTFPPVNIWEDGDTAYVEAELPGIDPASLDINVTGGNQLSISGERKARVPEGGLMHRQERGFGHFSRSITLPFPVNAERVDAKLDSGVLLVKLPKHETAKPRKIQIKGE